MGVEYFERLYAAEDDPWDFRTSAYEHRKYAATVAAVADLAPIGRALEVGCSIGELTAHLAPLCCEVVAVDCSPTAAARARERLAESPHVRVEVRCVPDSIPEGPFDLIVCSEVLYYWDAPLLRATLGRLRSLLAPGGALLAVHWRGPVRHYPLDGEEVHRLLSGESDGLVHSRSERHPRFLLDRFDRVPAS
jgi:cyclopropane fatty-acyl-phospholipid synthase-like methyltransferase